jgi:catalase-peroxidase
MSEEAKCPFPHEQMQSASAPTDEDMLKSASSSSGVKSFDWFPEQVKTDVLLKNSPDSDPYGPDFDYAAEFATLDLDEVKGFIRTIMTAKGDNYDRSLEASKLPAMPYGQEIWWPADWGHYGPLFIRLAWHSAGTYRVSDGRGGGGEGNIRFSPLNSWPDNVNLDKARRALWAVKERYGRKLSWADLFILAGNVALEDMGLKTIGFAGGRKDVYEPDNTYWGPEAEFLANARYDASRDADSLQDPLAAVQMGLIYVNPEGPDGNAEDFVGAARDIRTTFTRMAMNDEETVALIAGGHAFGKSHGAGSAHQVGAPPEAAPLADLGLGWSNSQGKGNAEDTISNGIEGAWTPNPLRWDNDYLRLIFQYEWEMIESPAGAKQWSPIDCKDEDLVPDAHIEGKMNKPMMMTTDLALKLGDEKYKQIALKFLGDFDYFSDVFAKAWFKLTHRDLGPKDRYVGSEVPQETFLWQDPVDPSPYPKLSEEQESKLRQGILDSDLDLRDLIFTAWVSASTYRNTDKRGGANGAHILQQPMTNWEFVDTARVNPVIDKLNQIKDGLGIEITSADLIVFAGGVGVEKAIKNAGYDRTVPFTGGRGDARPDQIDIESFGHLEPLHDGFINWVNGKHNKGNILDRNAEYLFVERAALLGLTPVEMVALFTGFRSSGVNHRLAQADSIDAARAENAKLDRGFLENLVLKSWYKWTGLEDGKGKPWVFEGQHYVHSTMLRATRADLLFGSNSVLRAIAETYAGFPDGNELLIDNFIKAWVKVMNADRFDIK